jgi:hypothetical protein
MKKRRLDAKLSVSVNVHAGGRGCVHFDHFNIALAKVRLRLEETHTIHCKVLYNEDIRKGNWCEIQFAECINDKTVTYSCRIKTLADNVFAHSFQVYDL